MAIFPGIRGFFHKVAGFLFDTTTADPTITTTTGGLWMRSDVNNGRLRFQDYTGVVHSLAHVDELTSPVAAGEELATSTAASITKRLTRITTNAATTAITLADGTAVGFRKSFMLAALGVAGQVATITPATFVDGTRITLSTALSDSAELEWSATGWKLVNLGGSAVLT